MAFDSRDHWFAQQHSRHPERRVTVEGNAQRALPTRDRAQIRARAERASGAGEDGDREGIVGVELAKGSCQRGRGWPVDRVAHLRPVDDHDKDGPSRSE